MKIKTVKTSYGGETGFHENMDQGKISTIWYIVYITKVLYFVEMAIHITKVEWLWCITS